MKKLALSIATVSLLIAGGAQAATLLELTGDLATPADASRTIVISPTAKYANVTHGDVVKFVAAGQEIAYRFNGASSVNTLDLRQVMPSLDHKVTVYIAPNPDDISGSGTD